VVNWLLCCLALAAEPAPVSSPAESQVLGTAHRAVSPNFEVIGSSATVDARQVAARCERWRSKLQVYWLQQESAPWQPRCQIVIHSTRQNYLAAVGRGGGEQTLGSSWIEFRQQKVSLRKIDLLGVQDLGLTALPHELTHVIFADQFGGRQPPRWADEGVAMLADSLDKQQLHQRDLETAISNRWSFRVGELFALEHYPQPHRVPGFYGQSVSVAAFLARRDDPTKFVRFVQRAMDHGHDRALQDVYGVNGVHELDAEWRAHRHGARGYHGLRLTLDERRALPTAASE
jgi:hypothetical protein